MHVVAIYNNKGGVGKSTLTVGLAEFLAGNRSRRVLVIDLDAQASSAFLRGRTIADSIKSHRTIVDVVEEAIRTRRRIPQIEDYFTIRPSSEARGTALERIAMIVPDKSRLVELEEAMTRRWHANVLRDCVKPSLNDFDFVLLDLPGNVDRRNKVCVAGLLMSDFVLIPVEPPQISLNALPDTLDLIRHVQDLSPDHRPAIVGMVCNKTDRRTQQYRSKFPDILKAVELGELPPIFENFLPERAPLETATDGTIEFRTLKKRFGTYYDHVRKVATELERRCDKHKFEPETRKRFGQRFRDLITNWGS